MNLTTECYFYKHNNISKSVSRAPKQRIIHTHLVCENGHNSINYTAHKKARAKLSKNAFQLFDYLEFMPNDTVWALSSSNLYKESSLTEQTYKKAFEELLEKGYLVKKPITITNVPVIEDAFHFYEDPEEVLKPTEKTKTRATTKKSSCTPIATSRRVALADEVF